MAKPFRCRIGLHRFKKVWDHERQAHFKQCTSCGRRLGLGMPGGVM